MRPVKDEYQEIAILLEFQAKQELRLALRRASVQAIKKIVIQYLSHLPKWMDSTFEHPFLATQVSDGVFYTADGKFYEIRGGSLPLMPPVPLGDEVMPGPKTLGPSIIDFIEKHRETPEEIHLAYDWDLLRFQGKWAGGGQEDLEWTPFEKLIKGTHTEICQEIPDILMRIAEANGCKNTFQRFQIYDGQKWHRIKMMQGGIVWNFADVPTDVQFQIE